MHISRHVIAAITGVICILLLVTLCVVAIYDFYFPWPTASHALKAYGRHYRFCQGISSDMSSTVLEGRMVSASNRQRAFVLMRMPLECPRIVNVSEDENGHVSVEETVLGFWIWIIFTVVLSLGTWRFALKPLFNRRSPQGKVTV